jgi:hypothetical protein
VPDRTQALNQIVALARTHGVSVAEIADALGGSAPANRHDERRRAVLVRVLGVLGGIFVFAGIGVFVALQWDSMNSTARVIVTLGSGVATLALALLASRDERFEKAATPLFLVAGVLEPTGMLVAFDEFGSGGDWRWAALLTAGAMAVQFCALFGALRRSTLLFGCILFSVLFSWTAFDLLEVDETVVAIVLGVSMLLTAVGVDRTPHRDVTPPWYFFGAAAFLYGFFDVVEDSALEISFLAAAAAFVYLSAAVHSRTLLFVSTLAILAYTAYFTGQHFADSIGWPLALIGFGLFMIALSALAVRIDRDYVRVSRIS